MKRTLLLCGTVLLLVPAFPAESAPQHKTDTQPGRPTVTTPAIETPTVQTAHSAITSRPRHDVFQQQVPGVVESVDLIVPDHTYQPAGTAGVGFFGNGTGGSTIGSTPENGGTGYTPPVVQPTTGTRQPAQAHSNR